MKKIIFTVTNELVYDQRMQRICGSLSDAGYHVLLVGRCYRNAPKITSQKFHQKRLTCWFTKGKLMYAEFNLKLFLFLLFSKAEAFCAIDLDTILPVYWTTKLKNIRRVYDAHELFTEQKEIIMRPKIYSWWKKLERYTVPKFKLGYTVNTYIANFLFNEYQVIYSVVRNLPKKNIKNNIHFGSERFIIYQGAVNEGRSFETLIPAMEHVDAKLLICGEGNFYKEVQKLVKKYRLQNKVILKGLVRPDELKALTPTAHIAVMLFEAIGLNQYHSLANRFFDYIMAGVPQVCIAYPEYEAINDKYEVAYLIYDTGVETIATAINNLMQDDVLHDRLRANALIAREVFNWENEEKILLEFWRKVFD